MRIRWTQAAADDLESIADYLTIHLPAYTHSSILLINRKVLNLSTFPHMGRIGREQRTRELVINPLPYIVVYRIQKNVIEILHIHHGAQNRQ